MFKSFFKIVAYAGLMMVMLLAINLIAGMLVGGVQIDLTEENLYTLSDGSRELLGNMEDDVTIKFFLSRRLASNSPAIKQYSDRIYELLGQFENASRGKLALELLEPRPDDPIEEEAIRYGVQPVPFTATEALYMGLVFESEVGAVEVVGFMDPSREQFLEYDISRNISAVSNPAKQVIGVMSGINVMGGYANPMDQFQGVPPQPAWYFMVELDARNDTQKVEITATEIPGDIDLLLIVHPKGITPETEYAIDQYLMKGGKLIVMVDPLSQMDQNSQPAGADPTMRFSQVVESDLPTLLPAWGIEYDSTKIAGDLDLAIEVNGQTGPIAYLPYIGLTQEQMNQDEIISSNLEDVMMVMAGSLAVAPDAPYAVEPLIQTTSNAQELDGFMLKIAADPEQLMQDFVSGNQPLNLAVKITGQFKTAFPDGDPSLGGADPADGHVLEAFDESSVLIFADSDFAADPFSVRLQQLFGQRWATPINENLTLVLNAVENFLGSQELISLRTRGKSRRPFTRVDELRRQAQALYKAEDDLLTETINGVNARLSELQQGRVPGESAALITAQQRELIDEARGDLADAKRAQGQVRLNLRKDIESLGTRLKVINIMLWPGLVLLLSFLPVLWRAMLMK